MTHKYNKKDKLIRLLTGDTFYFLFLFFFKKELENQTQLNTTFVQLN